MGPNYHRPQTAVPPQWTAKMTRGTLPGVEPQTDLWWKSFHDAELDSLIERAIAENYDLKLATDRVLEARAAKGLVRSELFPQLNAHASGTRSRQFTVAAIPGSANNGAVALTPFAFETNNFQGSFDAVWELDIFGRIRRSVEASRADLAAAEHDRRNVLITLLGDVGRNYAILRGYQLRLTLAEKNISAAEETVELTRALVQGGQATERDVAQAEALLESLRAQVPTLKSNIAVTMHRLAVLLGQQPGALDEELAARAAMPVAPPGIPVGLPTDLLERRPDIQRAEAQLAAATARIGQAKADYFPRFTLFGTAGRQATQLHELTVGLGNFFSVGPSATVPLFTGGLIRSNVALQRAREREAFDNFESTVLTSLEEVENALLTYANEQDRLERLEATVRANQTAVDLAHAQYQAGLADFLTVLDSERELYANQDLLAQSQTAIATDLVALYKALGGGWSISPEAAKRP